MSAPARERLIVGLDTADRARAERLVETLGDTVLWYKIGYQLAYAGGLSLAGDLARAGKRVFVDLKLLDIPNTVANGIESIAGLGTAMTTVHAYPQTMRAAAKAAAGSDLAVIAVTVLTSMDADDLALAGYSGDVEGLVARRAAQAREAGLAGCVGAATEARVLRDTLGPDARVVTPGIRLADAAKGDQKRVATPAEALAAGASHLVVARPILQADDPRAAAEAILADMARTPATV